MCIQKSVVNAMNIISSTFNEREINRTVLGGRVLNKDYTLDIAVILLNKNGSHLCTQIFDNLIQCGFRSIISVEPDSENYNLEEISHRYPQIKFVIPQESATDGDLINACVSEFEAKYFMILRDSFNIPRGFFSKNLGENILKDNIFCVVPRLIDKNGVSIVVNFVPEAHRGRFFIKPEQLVKDGVSTLYPFDFIGIYNREKFINLGGFDYTITSPYWQNIDLALRSWLWGEKITVTTKFHIDYTEDVPFEKTTPDMSYIRFYLKNILPKFRDDHGIVKHFSFPGFYLKSKCGIFEAISLFSSACQWIKKNQFRFKKDIQYLIENWININEE